MIIQVVQWTPDLAVGVDVLDDDHRRLFALINKVIVAFYTGVGGNIVNTVMNELEAYTREHFVREISMLKAKGDPNLQAHHDQHENFVAEFDHLRTEKSGIDVIPLLNSWLVNHIMKTDMEYRHLFR